MIETSHVEEKTVLQEFEYVGFWPRLLACTIDSGMLAVLTLPVLVAIYGIEYLYGDGFEVYGVTDVLLSFVLPLVASVAFWVVWQATPGKMVVSARIVDARTGGALSVSQSFVRYAACLFSIGFFGLGVIWIGFDKRKQGWHDKIAGTLVVRYDPDVATPPLQDLA